MKRVLFASIAPLALAACGQSASVISTPPPAWTQPVAEPAVPADDSDASVAEYIIGLVEAIREANARLKRLDDWREGLPD